MHEKMKNEKYSEHCNASLLQIESLSKFLFLLSLPLQRLAVISILQPLLAQGLCFHPLTGLLGCYRLSWSPASYYLVQMSPLLLRSLIAFIKAIVDVILINQHVQTWWYEHKLAGDINTRFSCRFWVCLVFRDGAQWQSMSLVQIL